ncbi:MAG: sulfotransferase domain-containing protein [bacterium]
MIKSKIITTLKLLDKKIENNFEPSSKDVFLVSFPRSGNTWVRTLLSNLVYNIHPNSLDDLNIIIPDIYVPVKNKSLIKSDYHIVKSHEPFRNKDKNLYLKVIYLYRDPRDVCISYYKFSKNFGYEFTFEQFIIDMFTGRLTYGSWQNHINSWLNHWNHEIKIEILKLKYEDLIINPIEELKRISKFLQIETNEKLLVNSSTNSSVDNMKNIAINSSLKKRYTDPNYKFIGDAKSNQWENKLTNEQLEIIYYYADEAMNYLGYKIK